MEQKYYKIHNTNLYILEEITGDIDIEDVLEEVENSVEQHFLEGIETIIVSPYPSEGRLIEGNTIYIRNDYFCEDLLSEEIILSIGEFIFSNLLGESKEDISKIFLLKSCLLYTSPSPRD